MLLRDVALLFALASWLIETFWAIPKDSQLLEEHQNILNWNSEYWELTGIHRINFMQ